MTTVRLKIKILSYWHAGSGLGRGAAADALACKDADGLPFLPGKSLKGLLREGLQSCEENKQVLPETTDRLFGRPSQPGRPEGSEPGLLRFTSACLSAQESAWLRSPTGAGLRSELFEAFSSTRLDERGMADDKTLRTIELCLPVDLWAEIEGPDDAWLSDIEKACVYVRSLGGHRNRGLGRCHCEVVREGAES